MNPTNHKILKTRTDTWLTPPYILEALKEFDLDPCCPSKMPWKTAKVMWSLPENDGLNKKWKGRVWCNPPFKNPLPWIQKMAEHDDGIMLLPGKSLDSKWGQYALQTGRGYIIS